MKPILLSNTLFVRNCSGSVLLEDCRVEPFFNPPEAGFVIEDSERVSFVRCAITGSMAVSTDPVTPPSPAVSVLDSHVSLTECTLLGGAGLHANSNPFQGVNRPSTPGAAGVRVAGGSLTVSRSTLTGGTGGKAASNTLGGPCLPASPGGPGLLLETGLVRRIATTLTGGAEGSAVLCAPGPGPGPELQQLGGTLLDIAQQPATLLLSSPLVEGGNCSLAVTAGAFEPVLLVQALAPHGQWLGGLKGTLAGAPPYLVLALGSTGANGTLAFDFPLPTGLLPPGLDAITFVDQAITPAAGGGGLLSSPSASVLVRDLP
jgi:hypothetical protein